MSRLEYKGYAGSIEYSVADNCWHGKVLGLSKNVCILYEGDTIEELYSDFQEGVDHYLDDCKEDGIRIIAGISCKIKSASRIHA